MSAMNLTREERNHPKPFVAMVYSVPHTGTHFSVDLLAQHGIITKSHHFNINPRWLDNSRMTTDFPKICPIRDPRAAWVTWNSREQRMTDGRVEVFFGMWKVLDEVCRRWDVTVLPVDTPDRDKYLVELGAVFNTELKTDWTPKGSGYRKDVEPIDMTEIFNLPIVKKFYPEYSWT